MGLEASCWATDKCLVSLRDERLFSTLNRITALTLILHGVHDKVCPFEYSGHGAFYEEKDKANNELIKFMED